MKLLKKQDVIAKVIKSPMSCLSKIRVAIHDITMKGDKITSSFTCSMKMIIKALFFTQRASHYEPRCPQSTRKHQREILRPEQQDHNDPQTHVVLLIHQACDVEGHKALVFSYLTCDLQNTVYKKK